MVVDHLRFTRCHEAMAIRVLKSPAEESARVARDVLAVFICWCDHQASESSRKRASKFPASFCSLVLAGIALLSVITESRYDYYCSELLVMSQDIVTYYQDPLGPYLLTEIQHLC